METIAEEMQVAKYSGYKASGVEWLGEIPAHWTTLANKHIFSLKKNLVGKKSGNFTLLSLTLNGVIKRDMENPQGKFPAEFNTYQEVNKGDFIFCLFDVEETPRTVGLSRYDGMITGAYTVMQPSNDFDKGFLYYFYLNLDADKRLKPLYTGLRNTISKENFFSFRTFVPPKEEQTTIAQFLDRKTAQIGKAIGIKEKQIDLLKERRQVLIHNAVTCGLNPDVPMKDSGVEWIGEIPAHWEVKRMKNIAEINPSVRYSKEIETASFVPMEAVGEFGGLDTTIIKPIKEIQKGYTAFQNDDVLIAKITPCYENFKGAVAQNLNNGIAFGTTELHVLRAKNTVNNEYLFQITQSPYFRNLGTGLMYGSGGQKRVGTEFISTVYVPVPSIEEQLVIVSHIVLINSKISTAITIKEQEIEKLKEYKASLINSAVTGKIKVC